MKKILKKAATIATAAVIGCAVLPVQSLALEANYEVIPIPKKVMPGRGLPFAYNSKTVIAVPKGDKTLKRNAELLAGYLKDLTGITPKIVTKAPKANAIILSANLSDENPEAYTLSVNSNLITINGSSPAGNFYGIQTLRKSIGATLGAGDELVFPATEISDEPRFSYRGTMFDVSRHFFPADSVKKFIDMIALHNVNRLHWHLTDDQGWRVEMKKHPELTEIGSKRPSTVIGRNSGKYDGIPHEGYYTQDEIRDIVKYAADRHITVVPEIDLPGHMLGALAAYPELGCTGGPYKVWEMWGVAKDVLCAGNEKTFEFIDDVLGEIMDLFPSEYIHLGGDECPKDRWAECPKCQARIKELGLKSDSHSTAEQKLQSYVMERAANTLAKRDRKMIGWDEIIEGGLFPGATVMAWRGSEAAAQAAKEGHDAILTPTNFCYFDYCQSKRQDLEPLCIGGYVPVEKVYSLEPVAAELTPEQAKHIIGAQANLWTEYIPTLSHVQYMELPRLAAMCEVQWADPTQKNYDHFASRLPQLIAQYKNQGYNYAKHVFDVRGEITPCQDSKGLLLTLTTADGAPIYYTLDGSTPNEHSTLYSAPVKLTKSADIRAVVIRPDEGASREWTEKVTFAKSTGAQVKLAHAPHSRYSAHGPATLTDGSFGGKAFNSGQWIGFSHADLDAVIDLAAPQTISSVNLNTLVDTDNWIFDTPEILVEVSTDGNNFTPAAKLSIPVADKQTYGIVPHTLTFEPVEARYVRVLVPHLTKIPEWHKAGAGRPAFVFVDEIVVD